MKKYRLQAIVLVLVAFMLGCNELIMVGIISDIARQFSVSLATVGYLVTIFATVYAVSTPIITIYSSRFNRYKTLIVLMVIFLVGNTFTGLAPNYVSLVISRIMTACVAGVIISLVMTFATMIAPREKRTALVSWIFSGFSIASVFGVPIGTAISTRFGWRYAFLLVSVISVITLVFLCVLLPKDSKAVQSSLGNQLSLLKDARIYLGIALVLFGAATMYSYYTYIRPLLTTELGFNLNNLNWLLFLIGIMNIISNQISGVLAALAGLKAMPLVFIAEVVLLILLPFSLGVKLVGLLLLLTLTTSLLNSPIQIHFLSVAERDYPQSLLLASSLNSIFFNFGISIGSATASSLVHSVGVANISFGGAFYAVIALILVLLLNRSIANRQQANGNDKKISD